MDLVGHKGPKHSANLRIAGSQYNNLHICVTNPIQVISASGCSLVGFDGATQDNHLLSLEEFVVNACMRLAVLEVEDICVFFLEALLAGTACQQDLVEFNSLGVTSECDKLLIQVNPLNFLIDDYDVGSVQEVILLKEELGFGERSKFAGQHVCVLKCAVRTLRDQNDVAREVGAQSVDGRKGCHRVTKDDVDSRV